MQTMGLIVRGGRFVQQPRQCVLIQTGCCSCGACASGSLRRLLPLVQLPLVLLLLLGLTVEDRRFRELAVG